MPLTIEDGSGVANADALVNVAFVDDYASRYGKDAIWATLTISVKEVHIRRASQFADNKFPYPGTSTYALQPFHFPALGYEVRGFVVTGIPVQVKNAVAELAIISASGINLVDDVVARNYTYRRVKAEGFEKEERYADGGSPDKIFGTVEMILSPLLSNSFGRGVKTVRLVPGV
jgi:hypothetical protein